MARRKADIAARLPIRRGLGEAEAALYVGIGPTKFRELVGAGLMPTPRAIGVLRLWDIDELDAYFRALPRAEDHPKISGPNPWHT